MVPVKRGSILLLVAALTAGGSSLGAQSAGDERILIRNVRPLDAVDESEDRVVHILIKNGRIHLVTEDRIAASKAQTALDAEEGFLLGQIALGEPASFLILDTDPREDAQALLDTATHARFGIIKGEIVRNDLASIADAEEEVKQRKWLAYTPPPFNVPPSDVNKKKWNRFETKPISGIFTGAVVLDRQRWISQDAESEEQVGDLEAFDGGEIRGLRFGLVGTLNFKSPWVYTLFAATNGFDKGFDTETDDGYTLFDYRLDIPGFKRSTVSIGKQKEPISMERLAGGAFLPMAERTAVSDGLLPARNLGIVISGVTPKRRVTWALGGFNDWIDASQSFDESASQVVGRVTGLPFVSADESNLIHLGLGIRYTDAKEGLHYSSDPEFNLSPVFVDTGVFDADSSTTYDLEASWRRGPFWIHGEYLRNEIAAPELGDPVLRGHHLTASWVLSGEMRAYNRRSAVFGPVPVSRSVYRGGWGAWELALRWSVLDLTDGAIEGGEMEILSGGGTWWLTSFFNLQFAYRLIQLDRFDLQGTSDGLLVRLVLILE